MPVCFDCGGDFQDGETYCPFCGSPTEVEIPTDRDLKDVPVDYGAKGKDKRLITLLFVILLFIGLLVFIVYMARMISVRTSEISTAFY